MRVIRSISDMQDFARQQKRAGKTLGFVPTMGFLHAGHLHLIDVAKSQGDVTVVSIFVNPLQFGPQEDFSRYPRDAQGDEGKVRACGADVLFLPEKDDIFPDEFQTQVHVEQLSKGLCGAHRPGHFAGVATIVTQLFHMVSPDLVFFGEKDFQQLQVIRQLVRDLHFALQVVAIPTVRDEDGLALSSRNTYLQGELRQQAAVLPRVLDEVQRASFEVALAHAEIIDRCRSGLSKVSGLEIEYLEIVNPSTLQGLSGTQPGCSARLLAAIRLGGVRLIDNCLLGVDEPLQRVMKAR